MGLDKHQWVAVAHKDTDNRHIHIIANRISLYGEVYDTTFVNNRAARVAEEISRSKGLTIAKEVKAERQHQKAKANPTREQTKQQIQKICYALLEKYKGTGITGHSMFLYDLNKSGVTGYNTLKEEFLYDRENSSFSFNITCCLSRPFKRFTKDSLKSSRTNKKLFANNLEIVRELFFAFLIVPFLLFVFNNLSYRHSSTKYALRVRDNIYFRAPRNVLLCLTIYTFVKAYIRL